MDAADPGVSCPAVYSYGCGRRMQELGIIRSACKVPEEKLPDDAGAEEFSTQHAEPGCVPHWHLLV